MKKVFLFFSIICISSFQIAAAQSQAKTNGEPGRTIDLLMQSLEKAKEDTNKVKTLTALAYEFRNNNPDTAIYFDKQALQLSTKLNYKKGIGKAEVQTGVALINLGKYDEALDYLSRGLETSKSIDDRQTTASAYNNTGLVNSYRGNYADALKYFSLDLKIQEEIKDKKETADCYSNIGMTYEKQGKYEEAIKFQSTALGLRKEIGDQQGIAASLNFIGMVYRRQGDYAAAMQNYLPALKIEEETGDRPGKAYSLHHIGIIDILQGNYSEAMKNLSAALKIFEAIKNKSGIADSYGNIGWCYNEQGKYEESLINTHAALELFKELGDRQNMALYYNNIGFIYKQQGNYPDAMKNLLIAVKISQEIGDETNTAETYESIGETYFEMGNYAASITWLNKGLKAATEISEKRIVQECYAALAKVYEKLKDSKKAYQYYQLYIITRDSLNNEEKAKKQTRLEMNYEFEKTEAAAKARRDKKDAVAVAELQKQKVQKYSFIGGALLLLVLTLVLYNRYRLKQRSNKQLEEKNEVITRALDDLKKTQTQLVQSEKMASVGQLTAGIAHEINNPINFVSANIGPLRRDVDEIMKLLEQYALLDKNNFNQRFDTILKYREQIDLNYTVKEIKSLLNGIEEGSSRTAAIVKGLRNFSRLDEDEKKKADINEGIESTLVLLQNKLQQHKIEVVKSFGLIPEIDCFPGQLNQVFLNLLTNSIDAIREEGKIFVTTSYVRDTELGSASARSGEIRSRSIAGRDDNGSIIISIRDTGKGMSDDVKKKLFDPFFTTKEIGKGTGLGLSISYGIIEKHNGKIEVNSGAGKGTELTIMLPTVNNKK